jgi:hypothetical protein
VGISFNERIRGEVNSSGRTRHFSAFIRTAAAGLSAALAVVGLVLFAFGTAGITDLGAKPAQVSGELGASAHPTRCGPADFGAVPVEPNALGHLLDILLAEAGVGAMLAFLRTLDAGFDT